MSFIYRSADYLYETHTNTVQDTRENLFEFEKEKNTGVYLDEFDIYMSVGLVGEEKKI